jgi:hypothetical protein
MMRSRVEAYIDVRGPLCILFIGFVVMGKFQTYGEAALALADWIDGRIG